jgi:hypothetical protein
MRPAPMFLSAILLGGIACTDSRPAQTGQIGDSMAAMVSDTKPIPRSGLKDTRVVSDTKPIPLVLDRCDSIPRPKDCGPDLKAKAEVTDTKPTPR